ncbi:MAG: hypothetical protein KF773_12955 [Deltaproteobacteria bacterium]|nr:hypothetical protein [Deltaproteobacteria bacterium]MCW5801490.1 hypothetical protein [Deltaproteobacteria bacterium]
MSRWVPLLVVCCAACGDNLRPAEADAALEADAAVPPGPDAMVCGAGQASCDGECISVTGDEANCGGCDNACHGGEVCTDAMCKCPTGVIPPFVFPTGIEQFFPLGPLTLTLAPTLSLGGVNGIIFGHGPSVPLNTDIDLASVPLGSPPFLAAIAGLDVMSFQIDASYVATAGTIRFTKRCDTEIQGTLRNATFNGVSGNFIDGSIPTVDPQGCVIHVTNFSFHLRTAPCAD